jgi:ABC-type Fe3+-hydroxamate transport system substrate-binding protein
MRDDLGHELGLEGAPRSIVSLVPNLTELVAEWGLADRLIGVTDYCVSPPGAFPDAERIRGTKNPDTARIAALGPDLVLADQEESRRIDVERLRAAGLHVWVTRVRAVRDVVQTVRRLGTVLDRPLEAAALADEITAELDAGGREPGPTSTAPSVCMIWRDGAQHGAAERWWSVGSDTFAGDLLRCAGLPPVAVGEDDRYPRATLAEILEQGPRVVLLPDEPYVFTDQDAEVFRDWTVDVLRCSGRPLFWWGPRTPAALRWLRSQSSATTRGAGA